MGDWLKALLAAIAAAFAIFAATRHKTNAQKWQQKAVDIEESNVKKKTLSAEAASTRAKVHDAKADEIVKKAAERIKTKNETTSDILDKWRAG